MEEKAPMNDFGRRIPSGRFSVNRFGKNKVFTDETLCV